MANMRATTHAHLRPMGAPAGFRTSLRGLGQTTQGQAMAESELAQQGFSQAQIDSLVAAGADEDTMMGIATADNSVSAYNSVMSALTGVPASQLSSVGIGASAANWFNTATLISGVPNWIIAAGAVLLIGAAAAARYR